jgi:two-component system cell cycle response regulator DivK
VLFQCNPVGGSNQALGRQDAGSWAASNSIRADKFGNRLTVVLRHDPPCFITDHRTTRDCWNSPPASCSSGPVVVSLVTECNLAPLGSLVCDFYQELLNQKLANFGENSSVRIYTRTPMAGTQPDDPIIILIVEGCQDMRSVKRILIVEDNQLSLTLLNDFLKVKGYEILKTSDGWEAINLARDKQPDLILMDIKLPEISGFDVTRLLKQDDQTKNIPIIAVTAFATPGDETMALESGCDGYITKPVILDNLLRTIESFL